ncbi:MAG TPA: hypothetical protein VL307_14220 [Chitinophagaceae bacterium]|nr:hypothetical protein [Chitinophagaceae bacterium]
MQQFAVFHLLAVIAIVSAFISNGSVPFIALSRQTKGQTVETSYATQPSTFILPFQFTCARRSAVPPRETIQAKDFLLLNFDF